MGTDDETFLLCHRCGRELFPGRGDFYVVRIEAIADPSPPELEGWVDPEELAEKIDELIDQMRGMTERELMDQVYRRLTLHLCGDCYRVWIEDPAR
ncbi:MAG: hypothetical protein MUP47_06940 [Phycisphaerae bacterium]|nr:hypothetical protein [Phycisphaerae bacterium]